MLNRKIQLDITLLELTPICKRTGKYQWSKNGVDYLIILDDMR